MTTRVIVSSQNEFDACVAAGNFPVAVGCRIIVTQSIQLEAGDGATVVARGSSQPHVVARGHCQLSLFSSLFGFGRVIAECSDAVSVLVHGARAEVRGGRVTRVDISTQELWCEYYGVDVADGVATLFKAVDSDYSTSRARPRNIFYRPGETPSAPDWDGGAAECGGGLHFSPTPAMALEFNSGAKRFVACPVRLADIAVHPDGEYPQKVKARGCCAPVWEVDRRGARIVEPSEVA